MEDCKHMRRIKFAWIVLVAATLVACGSATQTAPTVAPAAPIAAAPANAVTAVKPVFMDFYAVW